MVAETGWSVGRLVYPLFVSDAPIGEPTAELPGLQRRGVAEAAREAAEVHRRGVGAVLLFGVPERKDREGSGAWDPDGPVPRAIRAIRSAEPDLVIAADVCLCEYTDHGHCGIVDNGSVDNDATLPLLRRAAICYAESGADWVAPSAMMDHQVAALRAGLDDTGHSDTAILAYSAKYASSLYGPFREAAGSRPSLGDRRGYQMDPRNAREALRELELDADEGADLLMVKPALPYLDVLERARGRTGLPLVAYQVSGEYAMIKAAAARGWLDEAAVVEETMIALRRAGADLIVTYYAGELARGTVGGSR